MPNTRSYTKMQRFATKSLCYWIHDKYLCYCKSQSVWKAFSDNLISEHRISDIFEEKFSQIILKYCSFSIPKISFVWN